MIFWIDPRAIDWMEVVVVVANIVDVVVVERQMTIEEMEPFDTLLLLVLEFAIF